jgi:hypothetical protein
VFMTATSHSGWNFRNKVRYNNYRLICLWLHTHHFWILFPIYCLGPSFRSWTVFIWKQPWRSHSIIRRRHQIRSLIQVYSRARTCMWACWLSLQKEWRFEWCTELVWSGQKVLYWLGQSNEGG